MTIEVINQTKEKISQKQVVAWTKRILQAIHKNKTVELTIVFIPISAIKTMNRTYRNRDHATDILSFDGEFPGGELIICPKVIKANAKQRKLKFFDELSYVILHGILHLAGHDHEKSKREAQKMFQLQDRIYNRFAKEFSLTPVSVIDKK